MSLSPKMLKLKLVLEAAGVVCSANQDDILSAAIAFVDTAAQQNLRVMPTAKPKRVVRSKE